MTTPTEKPLFIPLKREHFEAFRDGIKHRRFENMTEYRPHGPRWNIRTCRIGRRVTLSLGYGKAHRLHGEVVEFDVEPEPGFTIPAWRDIYGDGPAEAACIGIKLVP